MFKNIFPISIAFFLGFSIASSNNSKLKNLVNHTLEKGDEFMDEGKKFLVEVLTNIEGLDPDEIKANYERIIDVFKDKFDELVKLSTLDEQLNYAKDEIGKLISNSEKKPERPRTRGKK